MNRKLLIKLINITMIFVVVIILLQSVLVVLKSFFNNGGEYIITTSAEEEAFIKEKPLLDITTKPLQEEKRETVEINTKQDVILAFNNYFKELTEKGGYSIEGSSIVVGTALGGITAYQASYFYSEAKSDGSFYFENGTAEVEGPNGKKTGYGAYLYARRWVDSNSSKSQTTTAVSVHKDKDRYVLTPNFDGVSEVNEPKRVVSTLFKFELNEESITSCNISKRAMAYVIELSLNSKGLQTSINHIRKESNAVKDPTYNFFTLTLHFNTSGKVTSITTNEEYVVTVNRPVIGNISSLTKDNCAYIINIKEKEKETN